MDAETVQIRLLGTTLTIRVDEEPEYITKLLDFLEAKVEETSAAVPSRDPLKIAILSALSLADELFKQKAKSSASDQESEELAKTIIDRIDQSLNQL